MRVEKGRIFAGGTHAELIHVVLAEQHCAGICQPVDDCGVVLRDVVLKDLR